MAATMGWPRSAMADNDNLSVSSSANSETIKIGNTKTNNYHIQGSSFLPTQLTQVVLNVPKIGKKLRRTRQPTVEEMAIKGKILEIYEKANGMNSVYYQHLGRIIQALNPKYIATERVRRVAFGDPYDPNTLIPLPQYNPIQLELALVSGSPLDKLNLLASKFNELFTWDENIVDEFASLPDESLEPNQAVFKRVILCLSGHPLCGGDRVPPPPASVEEPATPVVAAAAAATAAASERNVRQRARAQAYASASQDGQLMNEANSGPDGRTYTMAPQQPNVYQIPANVMYQQQEEQPVMQAPQAIYNQVAQPPLSQRPKLQIPEEVKQRFYAKHQVGPNQVSRNGRAPIDARMANFGRRGYN